MFRAFQTILDASGSGTIDLSPYIESVEWDIYQISVQTQSMVASCGVEVRHNGFYLCASTHGSKDSASGPPDCVVEPKDTFTIRWFNGKPGDQANLAVWYNENQVGTTYSTAH